MLLSVIMPVYNGKNYIKNTIDNVLNSKSYDFELILVDDGSTDNSINICKEYKNKDIRVKVFQKENGGIVSARNYGLENASGKYVAFVDQDDYIQVDNIVEMIKDIHEADVIFFQTQRKINDNIINCDEVYKSEKANNEKEIFDCFIWPMVYPLSEKKVISYIGHVWAGVYNTSIIKNNSISFKRLISIEDDFLFVFDCLTSSKKVCTVNKLGYYWTYNPKSETYQPNYIDGFTQKCEGFYQYIRSRLYKFEEFTADYEKLFDSLSVQVTAVRIAINEGVYTNQSTKKQSANELKKYVLSENNRNKITKKYLGKGISRKTAFVLYWLIYHKLYYMAICFSRMLSLKHHQ